MKWKHVCYKNYFKTSTYFCTKVSFIHGRTIFADKFFWFLVSHVHAGWIFRIDFVEHGAPYHKILFYIFDLFYASNYPIFVIPSVVIHTVHISVSQRCKKNKVVTSKSDYEMKQVYYYLYTRKGNSLYVCVAAIKASNMVFCVIIQYLSPTKVKLFNQLHYLQIS